MALSLATRQAMEGVYRIIGGSEVSGMILFVSLTQ